jgi:two-component system response regulator MprA
MESRPKIVVIDDSQSILSLIESVLQDEYEVFLAHSAYEGMHFIMIHHPDIVIVDFLLPDMDGIEIVHRLKAVGNFAPIIAISGIEDSQAEWIRNKVDIFLRKPFHPRNLRKIVRAVLQMAKEKPVSQQELPSILRFADLELDIQARTVQLVGVRQIELTAKEFDLLALFMRNPRKVLTRSVILDHVWGFDFEGESNVVDVYVGYLRKKLAVKDRPQLIGTVRNVGYVLRESERGNNE